MEKYIKQISKRKKLSNSFGYAIEGLVHSFKEEMNMRIHLLALILVLILGYFLHISIFEWIICLILFGTVISSELFNTAIENTVDFISTDINPKAKIIKDISAASVFVNSTIAAIVGMIIFVPKILEVFVT